ncbi:MAG: SMC-Scp complex subunit ScpB [Candidatus Andersenbacteria bacterium]|nr:SMC-Scp complex subunit ScpB [Candidatus Andersenbacteria bacterium]
MNEAVKKIEALLFVAGEAVPLKDMARITGLDATALQTTLQALRALLEGHGLALVESAQGVQLVTAPEVGAFLKQFLADDRSQLSRAAAETLALIAYRGPISRYDVDAIRGVDCRRIISQLVYRGLVRKESKEGRAVMYDISDEFFMHMGVTSREQLPLFESLHNSERLRELLDQRVNPNPHSAAMSQDSAANNKSGGNVPPGTSSSDLLFSHEPGTFRDEKDLGLLS